MHWVIYWIDGNLFHLWINWIGKIDERAKQQCHINSQKLYEQTNNKID